MNIPAPKLFSTLPEASSLRTGATLEPAQLSYANGDCPAGASGFAPQRFATHTDSPSLSMATAFSAPQVRPSGSVPHGATLWYGLGRSLGGLSSLAAEGPASAPSAYTTRPPTMVSSEWIAPMSCTGAV